MTEPFFIFPVWIWLFLVSPVLWAITVEGHKRARELMERSRRRKRVEIERAKLLNTPEASATNYCMLLRSTKSDVHFSGSNLISNGHWISDHYDLDEAEETRFRQHIFRIMLPYAVRVAKNESDIQELVAIDYEDQNWQRSILLDLERSSFILVLPLWPSGALKWEIEQIKRRGWLGKTFFLMPPSSTYRASSVERDRHRRYIKDRQLKPDEQAIQSYVFGQLYASASMDLMLAWSTAREQLALEFDISLPNFKPAGGLLARRGNAKFDYLIQWEDMHGTMLVALIESLGSCAWTSPHVEMQGGSLPEPRPSNSFVSAEIRDAVLIPSIVSVRYGNQALNLDNMNQTAVLPKTQSWSSILYRQPSESNQHSARVSPAD